MERRLVVASACLSIGLLVVCGCKRKAEPGEQAGTSTVTSAAIRNAADDAIQRVAFARCQQELSCSNLTSWTLADNQKTCIERVKADTARELSPQACPKGIDHDRLVDCVAAIERTGCDDPVARLMQLEDCKKSRLCSGVAP